MIEGRVPDVQEAKLQTPQWALDRAAEYATLYVEVIRSSGVNVLGDLNLLSKRLVGPTVINEEDVTELPISAATAAILGALGGGSVKPLPTNYERLRGKMKRTIRRKKL